MAKKVSCSCHSCFWYLQRKEFCMAKSEKHALTSPCCSEFKPK